MTETAHEMNDTDGNKYSRRASNAAGALLGAVASLFLWLPSAESMDLEFLRRIPLGLMSDEQLVDRFLSSPLTRWQSAVSVDVDADGDIPGTFTACIRRHVMLLRRITEKTSFRFMDGPQAKTNLMVVLGKEKDLSCGDIDRTRSHVLRVPDGSACAWYEVAGESIQHAEVRIGRTSILNTVRWWQETKQYGETCPASNLLALAFFTTGYYSPQRFSGFSDFGPLDLGPYHYVLFQFLYEPSISSLNTRSTIKEKLLELIEGQRGK